MPLEIETFTNPPPRRHRAAGGAALFKAVGHPLAVPRARALVARLEAASVETFYQGFSGLLFIAAAVALLLFAAFRYAARRNR